MRRARETALPYPKPPGTRQWFAVRAGLPVLRIDFAVVAKHRAQIERNHGATLEALHAAGGLDWYELWCGFHGRDLFPSVPIAPAVCREAVLAIVMAQCTPEGRAK